jgi:hypothetical protein
MMKYFSAILMALALFSLPLIAGNFVVNGDFEDPLSTGWSQRINGTNGTITRGTGYDPDPDYEAYVRKVSPSGNAELYQIFDVQTMDMELSANLKLYAYDTGSSDWAGAALILTYLDVNEGPLGGTYIAMQSSAPQWVNSSTKHVYTVSNTNWNYYAFNIDDEFAYLPDINKEDVAKIKVSLYSHVYYC